MAIVRASDPAVALEALTRVRILCVLRRGRYGVDGINARIEARLRREEQPAGEWTHERWTPSTGQLINVATWNLLRYLPVKMRGAEDDQEETAQSFASV